MENILRTIVRHFVFVTVSFISLYLVVISLGGGINFFSWAIECRILFGVIAHIAAVAMHGYWYENR